MSTGKMLGHLLLGLGHLAFGGNGEEGEDDRGNSRRAAPKRKAAKRPASGSNSGRFSGAGGAEDCCVTRRPVRPVRKTGG